MVDFNNDATMAAPAVDISRVLILEAKLHLREAIGAYLKEIYAGANVDVHIMRSRLYELFLEVCAGMRRHLKKDDFEELSLLIDSKKVDDIIRSYHIINTYLDDIGLTKVDVKQKLGGNIAARNKAQGWKA